MNQDETNNTVEKAVSEGGAYDVIRKRLQEQIQQLESDTYQLNAQREQEFGKESIDVIGRFRARTDNNCVPRDIVRVGSMLLFGYNVFIGLKKETKIADVFALYQLEDQDSGFSVKALPFVNTFLDDSKFKRDFQDLYDYYKETRLIQLQVNNGKLLCTFQIGQKLSDIRVFRWQIDGNNISYIDERGERDIHIPPAHDFDWRRTKRDDHMLGEHPHISIADKVFVETVNGDLTIKMENNTTSGSGIYAEEVVDQHQSLDDADVYYADLGVLVLLKIRPYREQEWRYFIINTRLESALRMDAIGLSCLQLPENHGLIYPGGIYLVEGEHKTFDRDFEGFYFKRLIKSPNGEDVLFVFYEPELGERALFSYNLIRKELSNPLYGHGYCIFENGHLVIFKEDGTEATRIHPMQIFKTPFMSDEYVLGLEKADGLLANIGNAELVKGISELLSLCRAGRSDSVSIAHYEAMISQCKRMLDAFYWFDEAEVGQPADAVKAILETSELVLDEYEKVASIQKHALNVINEAKQKQEQLIQSIRLESFTSPNEFVTALSGLRQQRGQLLSMRDIRYINAQELTTLEEKLLDWQEKVSQKTVEFMQQAEALEGLYQTLRNIEKAIDSEHNASQLAQLIDEVNTLGEGLDLIVELFNSIKIEDTTKRTEILESISKLYADLNQVKAKVKIKQTEIGRDEAVADFSAQMTLLSQSITSALSMVSNVEECDNQLARLLIQVEEIESAVSDFDEFLAEVVTKREEIIELFEEKKQYFQQEQQRRVQAIIKAAERIFQGIERRLKKFRSLEELNTYFSSDMMVQKIQAFIEELNGLDANVASDDLAARVKALKDQGVRSLRDTLDLYSGDGNLITLGKHQFSVNTQELDLTLLVREEQLQFHLLGTDYYHAVSDESLRGFEDYWRAHLVSETQLVYRGEYLAYSILNDYANKNQLETLYQVLMSQNEGESLIKKFAARRFQEGYEKGIHDHDAYLILKAVLSSYKQVGLLRYSSKSRALAWFFWQQYKHKDKQQEWQARAKNALRLDRTFPSVSSTFELIEELKLALLDFYQHYTFDSIATSLESCASYLTAILAEADVDWVVSKQSEQLYQKFISSLEKKGIRQQWQADLQALSADKNAQWLVVKRWLEAFVHAHELDPLAEAIPETIPRCFSNMTNTKVMAADPNYRIEQLLGTHPLIKDRSMEGNIANFLERLAQHKAVWVPKYQQFVELRQQLLEKERAKLRLNEFKAKPLSSFVRNKLINDTYLPIIGDNLAKQMGTVGDNRRTDLMGLLLLISPPGYGKTTLMEYLASCLGLVFMKINCPSIGHHVTSLDPATADNATARQELEKLNLALEMGNNVMLYLDDIQHTNPEFLQKFISLCDGSRRIEGVWQGQTKTYDMRGKKFCVIMAGNPYTESGEVFKIPDMLANRADIYNLGDMLSGNEEDFALSYIENSLTSNSVLQVLATRDMEDVYRVVRMARGENLPPTEFSYAYNSAELNEMISVMQKLFIIRDVVWRVNQEYIRSAATDNRYRTEPAFKLQGSYRNMNKMTEKVSAIMNEIEIKKLIDDHYLGESQLLTSGAEENILKLAEIRNTLDETKARRWAAIKKDFLRIKSLGGDDSDGMAKVANQMANVKESIELIGQSMTKDTRLIRAVMQISKQMQQRQQEYGQTKINPEITIVNPPQQSVNDAIEKLANVYEVHFLPIIKSMTYKFNLDMNILNKINQVDHSLKKILKPDETAEYDANTMEIKDYQYDPETGGFRADKDES